MVLFIWIVPPVVNVAATTGAAVLAATGALFKAWVIIQFLDHSKSSSLLFLIKSKSRDLQKLLKYFNGITTYMSNLFLSAVVPAGIFVFYSKDLTVVFFSLFTLKLLSALVPLASSLTSSL